MTKYDANVFCMVMPQLQHIYNNTVILQQGSSSKVTNAQASIKSASVKLALTPEPVKRCKEDDKNLAAIRSSSDQKSKADE